MGIGTATWGFRVALFSALGFAPLTACSSSTDEAPDANPGDGGNGGSTGGGPSDGGAGPGTGGSKPLPPRDCVDRPILASDGTPTGFATCENVVTIHRPERRACATTLPPVNERCADPAATCSDHSDCIDKPNGRCNFNLGPVGGGNVCSCSYGCVTDSDCGLREICECGDAFGKCVPATCFVDGDCGEGQLCVGYDGGPPGCGYTSYACTSPNDACRSNAQCGPQRVCTLSDGAFRCVPLSCQPGRPFLVEGTARVAPPVLRGDWCSSLEPGTAGLTAESRRALAGHWTEVALMEHASIAAFARFSLELLSLGAPSQLLAETHAAIADETVHARDAFALASAYGGTPVGPAPFADAVSAAVRGPADIVMTAILEGCIGETVASLEAAEALARATDPAVQAALSRVVPDEARHAALAWRFVQWVAAEGPPELRVFTIAALHAAVANAITAAVAEPPVDATVHAERAAHGLTSLAARREVRLRALLDVIAPCAEQLARRAGSAAGAAIAA